MTTHELKSYKVLIEMKANNEEDFKEQLDSLDCYELEWWTECHNPNMKCPNCKEDMEQTWDCNGEQSFICRSCFTHIGVTKLDEEEIEALDEKCGVEVEE